MLTQVLDRTTGEILPSTAVTGEIVPYNSSYRNLEEAESAVYALIDQGEHLRLRQIKILLAIRDQQLYRERVDMSTGQPFTSFDGYVKRFLSSSAAFSGDAPRTLRSWLSRYLVYVDGLNLPEDQLVEMGSHFEVALPLAAKDRQCQLQDENEDLPTGGMRLGRKEFESFIEDIQQKVKDSRDNPTIPELSWRISDTKDRVRELMGTSDTDCNFELRCSLTSNGTHIHWDGIVAFVGGLQFKPGDTIPLYVWESIAKGNKVVGMGE